MLPLSGEEILLFFFGELSGVGGDVVGVVMIGTGSMMAVFCVWSCVMVDLVVSGRVCDGGGGVSFSTQGVGRRTVVGRWSGGLQAAVATPQQRVQAASCFRTSS